MDDTTLEEVKEIELRILESERRVVKQNKEMREAITDLNKSIAEDKKWFNYSAKKMSELNDSMDDHVRELIHDTILKLESYEEAALAILGRK